MNNKKLCFGVLFVLVVYCALSTALNLLQKERMKKEINNPFGVLEFLHWNHSWNKYKYPDKKSLEKTIALMKKAHVG